MSTPPETYALDGFPAAAILFVRALERNREKIGIDHGLSASDLRALFWIGERGSVTPKALADHMEMTTGGITAISGRLVNLGMLHRVAHPDDRRSLYLELTGEGHEVMREIHADFKAMIAAATEPLTPEQLADFERALQTVAQEVSRRIGR